MSKGEIFPNPTVKQVIFQINFPNLFYLENKIGDFQLKIMEKFPESSLLYRRDILVMDVGDGKKLINDKKTTEDEKQDTVNTKKIWQFRSSNDIELNLMSNSLDINSTRHKSYNTGSDTFRETIVFVLKAFFELISIPVITRIGLRYIDECPLPNKNNDTLKSYYNTTFPVHRFNLEDAENMFFATSVKKEDCLLHYREQLVQVNGEYKIILDFDGAAINIDASKYLETSDKLYDIISNEYWNTVLKPVIEYMRQEK